MIGIRLRLVKRWWLILLLASIVALGLYIAFSATARSPSTAYMSERQRMVLEQLQARDITDEAVLKAMATVPRHEFVLTEYLDQAYADHPLPIGYGQTISQPYIVALMTQLAQVQRGDRVLEIGTGSGYQAAILAQLTDEVYSVEIIPELAASARERLDRLGYSRVTTAVLDGYFGWDEHAPYDAIIVTAAPDHVPPSLVEQLADGGRMVIPVGPPGLYQNLWLIEKKGDNLERTSILPVAFVPLTGGH
ncbi:MAG: protein-L-isoaspartate(D-aspartate) O-methyltransferase [Anaerolineae bacterium]